MELPSQLHQSENRYSLSTDAATETRLREDLDITLHLERRAALEYYQRSVVTMNEAGDIIENLNRRVDLLELQVASLQEENIRVHVENKRFRHLLEIFGVLPELHAESESEEPNASTEMLGDDLIDTKDETSVNMLEAMFDGDSDYESDYNPDEGNSEDSDTDSDGDAIVPLEEVRSMLVDVGYGNGLKVYRPWPNVIADDIMKMDFSEKVPSRDDDMPKEKNDGGKKEEGDLESEEDVDPTVSLKGVQSPDDVQHTTGFLDLNFKDDSDTDDEYIPEANVSSESDDTESDIETLQEEVMNLRREAGYGRVVPGSFHGLLTREVLDNCPLFNMKSLETIECMHEEGEDGKEVEEVEQEKVVEFNILDMDCEEDSESDVDAEYDPNEEEEQSSGDESESEDGSKNGNESESEEEENLTTSILHERLDVALVISTTNVSQSKAIKALEHNENYIIDAIMYLHKTGQAVTKQGLTIWPQPSLSEIKESLESYMSSYMSLEHLNINHNENSSISHLRLSPESPGEDNPKVAGSLCVDGQDIQDKQIDDPVSVSDEDDISSLVQISRAQSPVSTSWSVVSDFEEEEK